MDIFLGIIIPFLGTSLGAICVFFMKNKMNPMMNKALTGMAAGIMMAASVWSLLIPSMEMSENLGKFAFFPAVVGFLIGIFFLLILDIFVFRLKQQKDSQRLEEISLERSKQKKVLLLVFVIVLHNIPEGMAVGAAFAGSLSQNSIVFAEAFTLSIGIAIQNIPEGAIVSMPLRSEGMSRGKAFLYGVLSGVVEPVGAFFTLLLVEKIQQILPFLLSFAAGCMIYVIVQELIPESVDKKLPIIGILSFSIGFLLMMVLDVTL